MPVKIGEGMRMGKEMIDRTLIWSRQICKILVRIFQIGNCARKRENCHLLRAFIACVAFLLVVEGVGGCQISEYYCDNRKCVSLDKFCNGLDDCGDGTDEPRHCSPCNRTYYGEVGGTYSIAVHRPSSRDSQIPYVCQLTFAAGGSKFGDLVQLIFNSVTLGPSPDQDRYGPSDKSPTCREGHVTLNEPDRPATAGHWCGHDWGQAVFYSETSRVTLTLSLFNVPASTSGQFAFDFRLTFKFLRKIDSFVRYGPVSRPFYRGQLLPGTFCSLIYNSCDKEQCALQTPNFPGIYPRNITCYYAIRQLNAPVGHRAVIQLGQEKDHMIFVRNKAVSKKNSYSPGEIGGGGLGLGMGGGVDSAGGGKRGVGNVDELTIGEECDGSSDHVTVYDGYTIRDPVLLKFCGGGKFPTITSSGNELLMEFYSAPTDYLLQSALYTAIQGFHVDVEIKHLPVGSHTYVENHNCFFTVSSFQQKRGFLASPQHSLPSGTTCTYLLEGSPGEIVWISLLKFYIGKEYGRGGGGVEEAAVAGLTSSASDTSAPANYMAAAAMKECNSTYFQIWQGTYSEKLSNATLLAHLCEDTPIKRTCEFMLSSTTSSKPPPRACHPDESFISKGPNLFIKLKVDTTTVLRPAEFKLYYEFVDTRQDGEEFYHPHLLIGQNQVEPNLPKSLRSEVGDKGAGSGTNVEGDYSPTTTKFNVGSCSRLFKSQNRAIQAGSFTSPRNVFYFGRGGVTNLTCIYRFQGGKNERVKLTFNKISLAGGYCKSEKEPNSGRSMCLAREEERNESHKVTEGTLQLWEVPWSGNDSRIMRECLCEAETSPLSYLSVSNTMDIVLMVRNMQPFHDQNHFAFEGRYEFLKHPDCTRQQKLKAPGGTFMIKIPEKSPYQSCSHYPWEIQPQTTSHYIFLTIPGRTMKKFSSGPFSKKSFSTTSSPEEEKSCETRNRILVYSGGFSGHLLQIICPEDTFSSSSPQNSVEIFSSGWDNLEEYPNFVENPHLTMKNLPSNNQLILEVLSKGPGSNARYDIKYMQISRRDEPLDWNYFSVSAGQGGQGVISGNSVITGGNILVDGGGGLKTGGGIPSAGSSSSSSIVSSSPSNELEEDVCFKFKCPELNACISRTLFCDGVEHCPSGYDEAECEYFPIPKTYLVLAAASLGTFVVLSCCFGCLVCKKRREEKKLLMSSRTPTEEMFFGTGSMSMMSGGGAGGRGAGADSIGHHHYHNQREIVC